VLWRSLVTIRSATAVLCVALLPSCRGEGGAHGRSSAPAGTVLIEAAEEEGAPVDAGVTQQHGTAAGAGERVSVPAGKLTAGSTPGDRGRDPTLEPARVTFDLAGFAIDRLPFPNDPARPPVTGVGRERARELCLGAGGRLCAELEWERACRGPGDDPYPGASGWNAACASHPETCASGFGVLAMGGAMREWTSSDVQSIAEYRSKTAAAVRGARVDAGDVDHRCAHRGAVDPSTAAADLGFRCCYGEPPTALIPSPSWQATVRKIDLAPVRLQQLFASNRRLAALAGEVKYFREETATDTVRRRGKARGLDGGTLPPNTEMTTSPIVWNPVPGEQIVVATGQAGGKASFVVAFHQLPDGRLRVGSALIMSDEPGPIVLVYNALVRRKLQWTTCWECFGETGAISYRADNRVVITQQ
jgi:formylglycine-generating enzyme required for sulfatase activity